MKQYIILLFILGVCTFSHGQQLTLEQVQALVLSESFAVRSAGYQASIAEEDYKFYKSQLRPGLNLNAALPNYLKTSVPVTQPDGSINFQSVSQANSELGLSTSQIISPTGTTLFASTRLNRFDNFSNEMTQYNGIPVRFGLSQPIFGYNPWKYRKIFEPLLVEEAVKTFHVATEETLTNATDLYFTILLADQELKIATTNQEVNQELLKIAEERLALGKISKDEKLQLEIALKQASLSLRQAKVQRQQAVLSLSNLIGSSIQQTTQLETPSLLSAIIDEEAIRQSLISSRPEVIAYQRSKAQADADIAENKALFGPGANLIASFGLARGADNVSEIYIDPFVEQQVNLSLNIPLIDWGRRKAAIGAARLRKMDIEASFEQQLFELDNAVEQRINAYKSIEQEVQLQQDIVDVSAQRAKIANERYILGDIDITNLTIAQREKDQALRNYLNSLRNMWIIYQELRALTGYDILTNQRISY